jgi:hypothetical protein
MTREEEEEEEVLPSRQSATAPPVLSPPLNTYCGPFSNATLKLRL